MNFSNFIFIGLLIFSVSCATNTEQKNKKTKPFAYTELSVKEGGQWIDGKRGHQEYSGGTFKNVTELKLPPQHTDHTYYIRYEGLGLENNQIAYRIYLDWRNAIDIFGKKVDTLVLPFVGQDGFYSYHTDAPWGLDIFKAGKTLGLGSFGRYDKTNDQVLHFKEVDETFAKVYNEKKKSFVTIDYKGWKTLDDQIDLNAQISIFPRDRFLKIDLIPSEEIENICTGIVNFKNIPLITGTSQNGKWSYIATFGKQTVAGENDNLGMVVFYPTEKVKKTKETEKNHLIIFKPTSKKLTYYLSSAWSQEPDGIKTQDEFIQYINDKVEILSKKGKL
ncbi:DUF4861 family protein [Moheibacter sediminis]|uniref:DUF4861 domain-containing protein n=1 Tax=Moheibacter sediminis TaxID=1434700 RepID=A0A1W2CXV2_9FLAO|nr:DUF4861 family protein [Moheibacter sediminis]SMC90051.1 protein of unknown function [Moheibacter sediminis]